MADARPQGVTESDLALAQLLVNQGLLPEDLVQECLAEVARLAEAGVSPLPKLGEVVVSRGYLTPQHLQATLRQEPARARGTAVRRAAEPAEVLQAPPSARFGKYVRTDRLGAGGMGEVWKAWDTELCRWVALKFLKGGDEEEIARFTREAQLAGQLSHPNIAAIHEVGEDRDRHFIAMQFVDGRSLKGFPRDDARLLARMIRDAARAVHYANQQGIIHRDLKPDNLMVSLRPGAEPHVYVMDFGLARPTEGASNLSVSGFVVGTPSYMSPEQARGDRLDARTDVYSLGATLYELLAGRPPFDGPSVLEIMRKVTDEDAPLLEGELGTIAAKALDKDPARRYATVAELGEDLDRWLAGEPIHARRASLVYRARKRLAKRKAALTAVLVGAVALGLVAYFAPKLAQAQRFAAAYDAAIARVNNFTLATATLSERSVLLGEEAVRALEEALAIDARRPMAWVWMGRCLKAQGKDPSACWDRALAIDSRHAEALLERCSGRFEAYLRSRGEPEVGYAQYRSNVTYRPVRPETPDQAKELRLARQDLEAAERSRLSGHLASYLQALEAYGREDYRAAESALESYLDNVPWDVPARLLRARARRYQKKYAEAEKDCWRALQIQERHTGGHLLLCMLLRDQQRLKEALEAIRKAIALDPRDPILHLNEGHIHLDAARWEESRRAYEAALDRDPSYAPARGARAWALQCQQRYAEALEDYARAIDLDPQEGRNFARRAYLHHKQGRTAEALADYTSGIALDPTDPVAFSNRAGLLLDLGRHAEAAEDCARALALDPEFHIPHYTLARISYRIGRDAEGDDHLERSLRFNPRFDSALHLRARRREAAGRWKDAVEDLRKIEALGGSQAEYARLFLWIDRCRLGEREAATRELLAAAAARPGAPEDWYRRIVRFLAKETSEEAFLTSAASSDPTTDLEQKCEAFYYAGIVRLLAGDRAGARPLFEKSVATGVNSFGEYARAVMELKRGE